MATVIGEDGRFVTGKSLDNSLRFFMSAYIGGCLVALVWGFSLGFKPAQESTQPLALLVQLGLLALLIALGIIIRRKMKEREIASINFRKGATGEAVVARILGNLPDEYTVIHDLATPYGNLDHIAIGPKGVFVIETKNWKGLIEENGSGDILLNGKLPEKPTIKPLVGRLMSVRDKVMVLCDVKDKQEFVYFKGVIVFPSACVKARWGKTGNAYCVSDEQLRDYILDGQPVRLLTRSEIQDLSQAFLALTTMEKSAVNGAISFGNQRVKADQIKPGKNSSAGYGDA